MKNYEKYKTAEEAIEAYHKECKSMADCEFCPYDDDETNCEIRWLYSEDISKSKADKLRDYMTKLKIVFNKGNFTAIDTIFKAVNDLADEIEKDETRTITINAPIVTPLPFKPPEKINVMYDPITNTFREEP